MRIAVVQMRYPQGHRRLDQEYLRILSCDHKLLLVDDGKYFTDDFCTTIGAERMCVRPIMVNRWEIFQRLLHYLNLTIVLLKLKKRDYDALLFLNIHNALYYYRWLPKKKIVLFHHQDIDSALSFKPYHEAAKKVANRFLHICLAKFIKEGIIEKFNIEKEKVFVVHQPLVFKHIEFNQKSKENLIIGIGRSTEESIIQQMVGYDKQSISRRENSIIMRSKLIEYKGNSLTVIKGFLPRDEYESLYDRAKSSLVTYPHTYKLRYSGIIDDSLSKGLSVFANDNPCSRYFSSVYPTCVFVFKTPEELWTMTQKQIPIPDEQELKLFAERHSPEYVRNQFKKVFES